MIYHKVFFDEQPSYEDVLQLKQIDDLSSVRLLTKDLITKFLDEPDDDGNYFALIRAYNFLRVKKDATFFSDTLDLIDALDPESDEMLFDSASLYLGTVVSMAHIPLLVERLKSYLQSKFDFENAAFIFELIHRTPLRSEELIQLALKAFYDPRASEYMRITIASYHHPQIREAVEKRLEFLAPFIKYLNIKDLYDSEWYELGDTLEDKSSSNLKFDEGDDENFILSVLGHTDERTVEKLVERTLKYIESNSSPETESPILEKYLNALPDNHQVWLETAPELAKKHFLEISNAAKQRVR